MKKIENCLHCNKEYIPNRVGHQKFCSDSCRSRRWYLKNNALHSTIQSPEKLAKKKETKKEKENTQKPGLINLPDIINTGLGVGLYEGLKRLLTSIENKAATKKDIQELKSFIRGRYLPVNNGNKDAYGKTPYYDVETKTVVYFSESQTK